MSSEDRIQYKKTAGIIVDLVRNEDTPFVNEKVIKQLAKLGARITRRNVLHIMYMLYPGDGGRLRDALAKTVTLYSNSEPPQKSKEYILWILAKEYFHGDYVEVLKEME